MSSNGGEESEPILLGIDDGTVLLAVDLCDLAPGDRERFTRAGAMASPASPLRELRD